MKHLLTITLILLSTVLIAQAETRSVTMQGKYDFVTESYIETKSEDISLTFLGLQYDDAESPILNINFKDGYTNSTNEFSTVDIILKDSYYWAKLEDVFGNTIEIEEKNNSFILYYNYDTTVKSIGVYKKYYKGTINN